MLWQGDEWCCCSHPDSTGSQISQMDRWPRWPSISCMGSNSKHCRILGWRETLATTWLHIGKLACNCWAVTTRMFIAPTHNWPICQNCRKCTMACLSLLDTFEPILDVRAVTTTIWIAPSHDWPICQKCSKCADYSRSNLLDTFEPILDSRAVTVCIAPSHNHVTSTAKNNAKARSVAAIFPSMAIAVSWSPSLQ